MHKTSSYRNKKKRNYKQYNSKKYARSTHKKRNYDCKRKYYQKNENFKGKSSSYYRYKKDNKDSVSKNNQSISLKIIRSISFLIYVILKELFLFLWFLILSCLKIVFYIINEFSNSKRTKVLVAHDNKTSLHTTKVHKFARSLEKDPRFEVIYDQKVWKKGEKTSFKENTRRERKMVKKVDVVTRIVPNPYKTKTPRNKGAVRELQEAMHQGKPVIELHEAGAKESPYKPKWEKNYPKREALYLKPYDRLVPAFNKALQRIKRKKQI